MKAIENRIDLIIVDNTNLSAWEMAPYKTYAEAKNYIFKIKQINVAPDQAYNRQQHGVPQKGYEFMIDRFINEEIPPWWNKEEHKTSITEVGELNFPPDEKSEQEPEQLKFDFAMSKSIHGLLKIATVFERKLKRQNH